MYVVSSCLFQVSSLSSASLSASSSTTSTASLLLVFHIIFILSDISAFFNSSPYICHISSQCFTTISSHSQSLVLLLQHHLYLAQHQQSFLSHRSSLSRTMQSTASISSQMIETLSSHSSTRSQLVEKEEILSLRTENHSQH